MAGVISSFYDQIYHHKSGVNYVELTVGTIPVVYSLFHATDNAPTNTKRKFIKN